MYWTSRRSTRLGVAAALAFGIGIASTATSAQAGVPDRRGLDVDVSVQGPSGAGTVRDGLTVEVYVDDGGGTTGALVDPLNCDVALEPANEFIAGFQASCDLPEPGDYLIGLDGVPMGWGVDGFCNDGSQLIERLVLGEGGEQFTYYGVGNADCTLFVTASALLIDKVVVGGPAASADFELQVLDSGMNVIAMGNDVADATCEADFDTAKCGLIAVPPGQGFTIAEPTVENYVLTSVECDEFVNAQQPPDGGAVVSEIGEDGFRTDDGDTYCVVTNTYVPPPTTTTTTTTTTTIAPTTTTTTVAPTTTQQPTTTALDAGAATLPETGASGEANSIMALMAIVLIGAGGALLMVRRRTI